MFDDEFEWRELAGKDAVRVDYSVLSVGVMTLGLILIVELVRHKLDHVALHKPFYKEVLEGVYAELATLGIVEFCLHVLAEYHEDYDKAKKQVFADVHFLLFYTAILNALQSVLLYLFVARISNKLWVETELLELNHYVEIREEFDRTKEALDAVHRSSRPDNETAEVALGLSTLRGVWRGVMDRIKHPGLKKKHDDLILQIRFHELRVHFLQAYNLPIKLQISDYLLRSTRSVLIKLIHVSSFAWLLLTGVVNLFYYILGIVSYKIQDPQIVGTSMIWIMFLTISLFVVLGWLVSNKMKAIFRTIMESKSLWDVDNPEDHEKLAKEQRELFWGGDPKLVIYAIQFMQFGYAVAISTVIIFWEEMNDGDLGMAFYVLAIAFCYSLFIYVTAQVIPRYALCTSLAQLVDERRLHETVAVFRLEEAKRKEVEDRIEQAYNQFEGSVLSHVPSQASMGSSSKDGSADRFSVRSGSHSTVGKLPSIGSSSARGGKLPYLPKPTRAIERNSTDGANLMFELVKSNTGDLRSSLPSSENIKLLERRAQRKKNRVKQFSDGVAAMSRMRHGDNLFHTRDDLELPTSPPFSIATGAPQEPSVETRLAKPRRKKTKAKSEGVAAMASMTARTDPEKGFFSETIIPEHEEVSVDDPLPIQHMPSLLVKEDNADDASVDSGSSGYSDGNDVPQIAPVTVADCVDKEPATPMSKRIRERLYAYFMSRRYIVLSNVFGTMIAFFWVGQRVEGFLHSEGIASSKFTHFNFAHDYIFWGLTAWLVMFVIKACLALISLPPFGLGTRKEKTVVAAAVIDLILCTFCLAMFLVAEVQRCCNNPDDDLVQRLLAEEKEKASTSYYNEPPTCGCPMFGSRQYGGLGKIEPYVSLIGLRIFRHWLAQRVVSHWFGESQAAALKRAQSIRQSPFAVFAQSERPSGQDTAPNSVDEGLAHAHKPAHGHEETGTAAELWESAIGRHPDVVAEHGEFSTEVLRAMLGLSPVAIQPYRAQADLLLVPGDKPQVPSEPSKTIKAAPTAFALKAQYADLPSAAQGVIVAGKVGCSVVKSESQLNLTKLGSKEKKVVFEVDKDAPIPTDSLFSRPNARLVRSMRRCDRMYLPMLDKWSVVDVVLTRHEMVYFDVTDADERSPDEATEGTRQALIATKGGKGLRLCDVATGRHVVGHMNLSEIESIHVERILPSENPDAAAECPEQKVVMSECWKHSCGRWSGEDCLRGKSWAALKQDRMRILTTQGQTLLLRFYTDLDDAEHHRDRVESEDEKTGFLFKNNAFQWTQTIGRFCFSQLRQSLPNYGADDTSDELRDFLIVKEHTDKIVGKRGFHRSVSSMLLHRDSALFDHEQV